MKSLILLLLVITLSLVNSYAQNFLGKTKTQVKTDILKTTDNIADRPSNGYDRFWWGNKKIDCYAYFNNKGLCFLEKTILNYSYGKAALEIYLNNPMYHTYLRQDGLNNGPHEFVDGKITAEVFTQENYFNGTEYHFYFYKSQDKTEVEKFFIQYYKDLKEWNKKP
ncbi:MAG: hypothetical protein Q8T08_07375 [Ignavibacteria bacterium]|nr:hypothetical protein [Ignavibacteria bacterium]